MANNYYLPSHRHPLEKVDRKRIYTCDGCKMEGIGTRYRCSKSCIYELHPECRRAPTEIIFEGQRYRFYKRPLPCGRPKCPRVDYCTDCRSCDACGKTVKGYVYHYSKKDWDLHPRCARLESKINIGDVTFWLEKQGPTSCAWCKKKRLKGAAKRIPGWSYVSKYDEYNFHVYCVMEMAMQISSTTSNSYNNNNAIRNRDSSNNPLALAQGMKLPLNIIKPNNGGTNSSNKWIKILKIFMKMVTSILLGDPTGLVYPTIDVLKQVLHHQVRR